MKKIRPRIKRIIGLTGTPSPNGLLDLWAQVYLLDQGERLGKTITEYRERYFVPDKRSAERVFTYRLKDGAEDEIKVEFLISVLAYRQKTIWNFHRA